MKTADIYNGFNTGSMTITAIEPVKRNVFRIYLNGEIAMRLPLSQIEALHITEGMSITYDQYDKICSLVLLKMAKIRCMDILTARDKTEKELLRILYLEDYPQDVALNALDYVKKFHYVDDHRYAMQYISSKSSSKSKMQITMMLREKGISDDVIEQSFAETEDFDQASLIRKLAVKKNFDEKTADEQEKRKFYQSLIRKGFSYYEIVDALRHDKY